MPAASQAEVTGVGQQASNTTAVIDGVAFSLSLIHQPDGWNEHFQRALIPYRPTLGGSPGAGLVGDCSYTAVLLHNRKAMHVPHNSSRYAEEAWVLSFLQFRLRMKEVSLNLGLTASIPARTNRCKLTAKFKHLRIDMKTLLVALVSMATLIASLLIQSPAMALSIYSVQPPQTLGAMSNKFDAAAKDAEGKIQAAAGSITGDKGQKLKGEAKQVQADAMRVEANVKDEVKRDAKRVENATS
jgi:uncharacterized protein YjbJ (UPF0337 family)